MMMNKLAIVYLLLDIITIIHNSIPQTNCLIHNLNKIFILLDLKKQEPYQLQYANQTIYFNFCDAFQLKQCKGEGSHLAFMLSEEKCYPLTSSQSGQFSTTYEYDDELDGKVLSLFFYKEQKDYKDYKDIDSEHPYKFVLKIACSVEQFNISNYFIREILVSVIVRSIHGCPIYEAPALLKLIDQYELLIVAFMLIVGFLFLFYGRVMIKVTAFFSASTMLIISLTYLCFRFMEQNVEGFYLYLTLIAILIGSFTISYLLVTKFIKASLFFIGALFGFFIGSFSKALILAFLTNNSKILYFANGLLSFFTISVMALLGSLTLQHKQYVIIYSTALSGSYLKVRAMSLLFGGFPSEYQIYNLIESKRISSIPLAFFIYLLIIILLSILGSIYQQLKMEKENNIQSRKSIISERVSSYIEGNLDMIHSQIDKLIDRYRISAVPENGQLKNQQANSQQMDNYIKMEDNQKQK